MSAIRITHGTAEVELEALREIEMADGTTITSYAPDDLIAAVVMALKAVPDVGDRYGGMSRSEEWLAVIHAGAEARGVTLP